MEHELEQHQVEIERNRRFWDAKPLLREVYAGFYDRIVAQIDRRIPGRIVEIGSGIGQLKSRLPEAISTDLFMNPWLDLTCDGYDLPFRTGSLSHLILFDVFHHLEAPGAFLEEARRVLSRDGRLILFEPYISWLSKPVYGLFHHEPVAWRRSISRSKALHRPRRYYAAQGNATRIFFNAACPELLAGWQIISTQSFASLSYLLSGGFSKPACYSHRALPALRNLDERLSRWPKCFGARCLITLQLAQPAPSNYSPN